LVLQDQQPCRQQLWPRPILEQTCEESVRHHGDY
jgi:hypothetical protein